MNMEKIASVLLGYLLLLCIFKSAAGQDNTTTATTKAPLAETPVTGSMTGSASASTAPADSSGNDTTTTVVNNATANVPDVLTATTANTTGANDTTTVTVITESGDGSGSTPTPTTSSISTTPVATNASTSLETTTSSQSSTKESTSPTITTEKTVTTSTPFSTSKATTTKKPTTTSTTTTASTAAQSVVLPVSLSLIGLLVLLLLILLYYYCTGKDLPCVTRKPIDETIEISPRKPSNVPKFSVGYMSIDREEFEVYHKRKTADDGRGYREEFGAIRTESGQLSAAKDPDNATKNRYDNVLPWDSSRVTLSAAPDGDQSDTYINANFVPGYLQEKKFIACQGPTETTSPHFWQMIWERKCATIVMVTNLIEAKKLKCHQYWPGEDTGDPETAKYGPYVVTTVDVKIRNYYVMRTLKLQWLDFPPRMIRQLHYTAWPDFGVPKNPHELLLFRRRVIAANPPHSGPIVIHCSAGVGRTGTFILIDAAMEQLQAEGKADLFSFLTKMRKYRMMLVQTEAQYTFSHAAVLEHIKYGDTEVAIKKFRTQVQSLREYLEGSDATVLEEQFSSLLQVQMNKDNMKHGRQSIKKNRVLQIIPYDDNRVTLPLKPGQEKTDYINASLIDGFKAKGTFIATQGPLAETSADFWMMVWIYQSRNIVVLTGLVEKGHEMCTQYWPKETGEEQLFGDISVKYVSKDEDEDVVDYVLREFVITNSMMPEEPERKVRQFHYTGWPEVGSPADAHGLIEIANRLSPEDQHGHNRPSIVHCSSGGGRTGVFIALNILMEQVDSEGMVDVFQTVKSLRAQRPHIIQSQEQLYFCYAALLQYLETNQLAGDNTTLSSGITSSVEGQSEIVTTFSGGYSPSKPPPKAENSTPRGSMNNKLDAASSTDQESKGSENGSNGALPSGESSDKSPTTSSAKESTNQDAPKQVAEDENGNSSNSHSDFEVVNENGKDIGISV